MAKSSEERAAQRFLDTFNRLDFNASEFAYYFTRAGWVYQGIMWNVVRHLMEHWANDLDVGEDKGGHAPYVRQTIFARQILDLMEEQDQSIQE
jgi:hypothetical protein